MTVVSVDSMVFSVSEDVALKGHAQREPFLNSGFVEVLQEGLGIKRKCKGAIPFKKKFQSVALQQIDAMAI